MSINIPIPHDIIKGYGKSTSTLKYDNERQTASRYSTHDIPLHNH